MIPIDIYTDVFFYVMLFAVLVTFLHTQVLSISSITTLKFNNYFGTTILIFTLLYIGLRPIHGVFVDMKTYAKIFERFSLNEFNTDDLKDPLFYVFMYLSSKLMTVGSFFFICAFIYIYPLYLVSKKWFKEYWFYGFLLLIVSFSFWNYGTNGIRNGMATSVFLYALSKNRVKSKLIWLALSVLIHKTMLLPVIGYLIYYKFNPKLNFFYALWLVAIPFSLVFSGFWESFFLSTGFEDERMSYLNLDEDKSRLDTSFRWDFLLYSFAPIIFSYYYIKIKKFEDFLYSNLVATYLFANAFWILVIRANFSNRFAYLSWFLIAPIIIYPILKHRFLKRQHSKIGYIILFYYAFTFIMIIILNK